jgi:hypothetical protein
MHKQHGFNTNRFVTSGHLVFGQDLNQILTLP